MAHKYAVLGSGMQGTAAAYDLARWGDADEIWLGDRDLVQADQAAARVNQLVGREVCRSAQVDASALESVQTFLSPFQVVVSCLPYWLHPGVARAAIAAGTSMVDLGGKTDITLETLGLDEDARRAGVSLVPDTGLAPGLVNSLALYLMESMDSVDSIRLFCGVLPQNPVPPLNYKLTFNVDGLVNEYDHQAVVLRDGEIVMVDTLTELEELEIEGHGRFEAFVTSGGTSTAPYTFQGRVRDYEYKTIRFPGHCQIMRAFQECGFWREEPVSVGGGTVVPRDLWMTLVEPTLRQYVDQDQCFVRAIAAGQQGGRSQTTILDLHDVEDPVTGFTSMERLTGFSASIYAIEIAQGRVQPGAIRYENAVSGGRFIEELRRRDISVESRVVPT
ncbi:MAG TPA: saccharopine dehydrogenase C-terminal domain-containing protein [Fimbriimonadaceae bacterium]|nr:saccharopine dehydrogenase C-terminal domain-containing protein [Fimbriimonadaceae bacterium]HRJ32212.1 saccharopine dehydrogenase C-terminal domain-containing protein [Fimbriimonadaceae bacterium]